MTATAEPAGIVFAKATRICQLDEAGHVIPGASVFVTEQLMKATITPVNEAGNTGAIFDAAGNLGVFYLKGDIPKWYTVQIEMVYPDPQIEALLTGGTLFSDDTEPLGPPTSPDLHAITTGGNLAAGEYAYETAAFSVFGRTTPSTAVTQTVSGSTSRVVITPDFIGTELGQVVYGRVIGQLQKIGSVPNIGAPDTTVDSGTGMVSALEVSALTAPIPAGTTFTLSSDTNSPEIVFTAASTAGIGEVVVAVEPIEVTITIAASATVVAVFVDSGAAVPAGVPNGTDLSGGPGTGVGQQSPTPGVVANPNGVSLEFFMERFIDGHNDAENPYVWVALPLCTYFVVGARDVTNAELQAIYTGTAFPNPNWGGGPSGQFPFDSSQILQWTECGEDVVPTASYAAQAAG